MPGSDHTAFPSRHIHHRLVRRRKHALRAGSSAALLAVVGPGLLAGLSDDDPAGITTYAVLGADYGYQLLWVLALSTIALVIFHEIGARMGVVTGRGLMTLVRERFGGRVAAGGALVLIVANLGTMCAELAGVAAGADMLFHADKTVSVVIACVVLSALVLGGSFRRIEHVLLALTAIFATYIISGFMAGPDWGAAARGLVVPTMPVNSDAIYLVVATVGTTLAPWGLTFIQSYAVDKHIPVDQLNYERVDVITGAVLTGVIGVFVVMASAATLHQTGQPVNEAADLAAGLEPLAGSLAPTLFGAGFLGAALLAGAVVPLATAFSVSESAGRDADLNASVRDEPLFYGAFVVVVVGAAIIVLIPGAPLVTILVATQALNAILLMAVLPFLMVLARDRELLGEHALGRAGTVAAVTAFVLIAVSVAALLWLSVG